MPQDINRKLKSIAAQRVIRDKKTSESTWSCCDVEYNCHATIGRHVHLKHTTDIEQWQKRLTKERIEQQKQEQVDDEFRRRRAPKVFY